MKKRKLWSVILAAAMTLMLLAGCSTKGPAESGGDDGEEEQIVIGYNAYGDTSDFSKRLTEGFIEQAEAAGMKVLRADTEGDATKATQNVDTFLQQGANVIVDSSWVVSACESVADKCEEAGVPCVIIDIYVENESAYYMGIDNNEVGITTGTGAAEWINENWDGELDYVLISFNESFGEGVRPRVSAVIDGLKENGVTVDENNVAWVDPQSSDAAVTCKQLGTDFLTAHPDSSKILMVGANDEMAQGLLAAAEASGRTDDCILVSNDLTTMGISSLYQDNIWLGSTAFFPENYGDTLVPMIEKIMNGEETEKEAYTEIKFVDRNNIADYYENPEG